MSEAAAAAAGSPAGDGAAKPGSKLSIELIVVLLNTLALAGAGGMLFYTKMLFKRPAITEDAERARLMAAHEKARPLIPGAVSFEQFTANIEPSPARPGELDGNGLQIKGRLHYATMAFSLELRDSGKADEIENLRPRIMDGILGIMGHKNFVELSSAQGRYMLRTQIVEMVNRLVAHYEAPDAAPSEGKPDAGSRQSASETASSGGTAFGDADYSVREGLVTNIFFNQFVVQ